MIEYYKDFSLEPIHYTNQFGQPCVEEWRNILISKNGLYKISILGRIKSFYKGIEIIKRQQFHKKGYLLCGLYINKKHHKAKVHRLVAEAFIENPLNLPHVNHNSVTGDKTDNRAWKLEWCTNKQNREHAKKNGLFFKGNKGECHNNNKLTNKDVLVIREKHKDNRKNYKETAIEYNVKPCTISKIVLRQTWTHI